MVKVLWFSRHEMTQEQFKDLVRVAHGDVVQVNQINKTIKSAKELSAEIAEADLVAIVAPVDLQQDFLRVAGEKPVIFAKNVRKFDGDGKVTFEHDGWFRLVKVEIVTEKL